MSTLAEWAVMPIERIGFISFSILGAYIGLIVFTRIAGIRSFSKMSGFDFAVTVAIGSIFASVIMAKEPPLAQGLVVLGLLFLCQIIFAALRVRSRIFERLSDNCPRLIMIGAEVQDDQLTKARMTRADLMAKLREANVSNFDQIKVVIAETTGDVSVIHHDTDVTLSKDLLDGIIGADRYADHDSEAS